jgi:SNF2 family DNA or RNA helicase
MIRRLKKDVLKELPDKNRQKVTLETDSSVVRNIKDILEKNNINKM